MSESAIIKKLVEHGILQDDHGFTDENRVFDAMKASLIELQEHRGRVAPQNTGAQNTEGLGSNTTPEAAQATQVANTDVSSFDLNTAKDLVQAGLISKNEDGQWQSKNPSSQGFADRLNQHEIHVAQSGREAMELLATDRKAFIEKYLAEDLAELTRKQTETEIKSLREELSQPQKGKPKVDEWFEEHKAELQAEDSPLKSAYHEIYEQVRQQHAHMADRLGDDFADMIHTITASQAELRAKDLVKSGTAAESEESPAQPGDSSQAAQQSQQSQNSSSTASNRSLVDHVNDGEDTPVEGQRNNGAGRSLNEHGQQAGDVQLPVDNRGRVDFLALADQTAKELGIE